MPNACSTPPPDPCVPDVDDPRVQECFTRRFNTATTQALAFIPPHTTNKDEKKYGDKCATYSKCIKQVGPGLVDPGAFQGFRDAIDSGDFNKFEAIQLGGGRTLNGPMGSYAYTLCGADSSQFGDAPFPHRQASKLHTVPAPPALASKAYATELVDLYWCSLLRDVAFTDYATNQTAKDAAAELSKMPDYQGPVDSSKQVTPDLLFRGNFFGETIGPYLSQFFLTPTQLGAQPLDQKYVTYKPGIDYMTDPGVWEAVQNGSPTGFSNQPAPPQYLHDGRGLAAYTHVDELFQAYFTAYLVLRSINAPANPGNPYAHSKTQNGFGTFAPPDFAAVLAAVAKTALNAVWYQKWVVHLRHRPESGGGLVHFIKQGMKYDGSPHNNVFKSEALKQSFSKYGTYLLSQAFPEGSPAHPAYPTGHGAVGGACITILKFFYKGDYVLHNPQVPSSDGSGLTRWIAPAGQAPLTVNGELHKLAHNVSYGHGLHGGIHWRSDSDVSMLLGEAVAISYLQDLACTYAEPFTVSFTRMDGTTATITNM